MFSLQGKSGFQDIPGDMILPGLDVYRADIAEVLLGFDQGADALLIQFPTAPLDLIAAKTWMSHVSPRLLRFSYPKLYHSAAEPQPNGNHRGMFAACAGHAWADK